MKKSIKASLSLLLCIFTLSGCGKSETTSYTLGIGQTSKSSIYDDNGSKINYTFKLNSMDGSKANITFKANK